MDRRLEIQNTTKDELRRELEQSTKQAVEAGLREMREIIDRFAKNAYLHKTWLTLEEAAHYADVSMPKLRDWRKGNLADAEVDGRIFIKREHLDDFIASHCNEA